MKRLIACAITIVAVLGVASFSRGENDPQKPVTDAGKLLASWAPPGAPANRGTTTPPKHNDLAMENYEVDEPFAKVWAFYAAKSGCKHEYRAGRNIEAGGGDESSRYLVSLVHNSIAGKQSAQCTLAVNSDGYTILVHLAAADVNEKKTYVNIIAGVR